MHLPRIQLRFRKGTYALSQDLASRRELGNDQRFFDVDHFGMQELLNREDILEESLDTLTSFVESCSSGTTKTEVPAEVTQALKNAQSSHMLFRRFFYTMEDLTPGHEMPPNHLSTKKANKVFGTPELLENILGYLTTKEKLDAMRVQHTWFNTINNSPTLLQSLGLASSATDNRYHSIFSSTFAVKDGRPGAGPLYPKYDMPGAQYKAYGNVHDISSQRITVTISVTSIRRPDRIGDRIKEMAICSPPLESILVRHRCDECLLVEDQRGPGASLESKYRTRSLNAHGFTVGEVESITENIFEKHRFCGSQRLGYCGFLRMRDDDDEMDEEEEAKRCEQDDSLGWRWYWDPLLEKRIDRDVPGFGLRAPAFALTKIKNLDYGDGNVGFVVEEDDDDMECSSDDTKTTDDKELEKGRDRDAPGNEGREVVMLDYDD